MKLKILVTGSAGFIGSHLVDFLLTHHRHEVFGVDNLSGGFKENIHPKSVFFQLDLKDKKKTETIIQKIKPDVLFHLAADAAEGRSQFTPISSTENNYLSYLNTLIPCIKNRVKKVILVSSMSIYGAQPSPFSEDMPRLPEDIYGIAKAAMEQATEVLSSVYGFSYVIIRPHNVYGPKQNLSDPYRNVIGIFINRLLQKKYFYIYGDGEQKRAFTYINDLVPYIAKAAFAKKCDRQIINLGPKEHVSINTIADLVLKEFFPDGKISKKFLPKYIPLRPQEVIEAWCTQEKAEKLLNYKTTTSLEQGLRQTVLWAKEKGPQIFQYGADFELYAENTPVTWRKKLI